jgi:hypothetical protein
VQGAEIASIGCRVQGVGYTCMDGGGQPIRPLILTKSESVGERGGWQGGGFSV